MNTEKLLYEERILELEKKLLPSIEALAQCQKENEEFIHIASHDLQAPLRKLSTFIERLTLKSREDLGEEALIYIEKINRTVAGMRSMIDDLSLLSDIGSADPDFIKCDLNKVMSDTINNLKLLIVENSANIITGSLPAVEADAGQIKVAFKTLIDNAIKFKNKVEPPKIVISSEVVTNEEKSVLHLPADKVYYKIEFADNGIGFKQEYADKIFKPFQRLHGKATYTGNGLGLAICKKIIERHLGIMYANGNENSGARFILILPETHN